MITFEKKVYMSYKDLVKKNWLTRM